MEEAKYYWMSYVLRYGNDMKIADIQYLVTDTHPALEIKMFKEVSPDYTVSIISWKEISAEEYYLWKNN